MDMHLNVSATRAHRRWTADEDTRLKKAVLVQTHDGKTQNWDAIAANLTVAHSGSKNKALSTRRLLWDNIVPALEA